jgi:hypothetical protein
MAAEDKRSSFRLPVTIRDARGQFMYVRVPAGLFDTGTGAKTIANLPKGTRVLDVKVSCTTALVGTAWTFSVQTYDGTTTTTLVDGVTTAAVGTFRAPGSTATNPPEVILNGTTTNTLILNVGTATAVTTTAAVVLVLTLARENT